MEHALNRKSVRGKDYEVDLESGSLDYTGDPTGDFESGDRDQGRKLLSKVCNGHTDEVKVEGLSLRGNMANANHEEILEILEVEGSGEGQMVSGAEQRFLKDKNKRLNNKKPSKPPRPPRGPSLSASDHKLISEISEIALLKRARIERIRALKKARAAHASSSSSSNIVAMILTIVFFVVIIFRGMSPRGNPASASLKGSSGLGGSKQRDFISIQHYPNPYMPYLNEPASQTFKRVAGSDVHENKRRMLDDVVLT